MLLSERFLHHGLLRDLGQPSWYRNCSPQRFFAPASRLIPWLAVAALLFYFAALCLTLFLAPADVDHGEVNRIVFIHVPASWVSMLIFLTMSISAGIGLAFEARLAAMAVQALAPTGLMFTFLGLWTGCLWSKAISGNWWVWDLRTHLELYLVCLYLGVIVLHTVIEDLHRTDKAAAVLLLAGSIGIPLNSAAVLASTDKPQTAPPWTEGAAGLGTYELASLLAMSLGFLLYAGATVLLRLRCVILERERDSDWVARRRSAAP